MMFFVVCSVRSADPNFTPKSYTSAKDVTPSSFRASSLVGESQLCVAVVWCDVSSWMRGVRRWSGF